MRRRRGGPGNVTAALLAVLAAAVPARGQPATTGEAAPHFLEVTGALSIDFSHRHFGVGDKLMIENMGPGVVVFDANGDERLDLYLVQGAPIQAEHASTGRVEKITNRLLVQDETGRFVDVTDTSRAGDTGYGMGASFGDYDGDGDSDLYVNNYGANVLYRNRGDGTFEDVTQTAGVACERWSVSSGFFDADRDGDLDLYVANYLDFELAENKWCGNGQTGVRAYCHPAVYEAAADCFYRNDGDGTFTEVSAEVGFLPTPDGKGLGVAFADLDRDGYQDVYVANDATMNYLYFGDGEGRFRESALFSGAGFDGAGVAESSMGVQIGDVDGDGRPDIFLTHLDEQTNTLYQNQGNREFVDATARARLSAPSRPWVGFGTLFFDYDNDDDLDIFVTNGHIIDNIDRFEASRSHRQPSQLFVNDGSGNFVDESHRLGLDQPLVGRGAAMGDLDRDGDLDVLIAQNDGPLVVLRNEVGSRRRSLAVRLVGVASNPQGFGARLELRVGERTVTRDLLSAASYASQSPPEVFFGLGDLTRADALVIHWPSGSIDRHGSLDAGFLYTFTEGSSEPPATLAFRPPGASTQQ